MAITRVLYKGELLPAVKLLLGVDEAYPEQLLYTLDCDVVAGVAEDTITGYLIAAGVPADAAITALKDLYYNWCIQHYSQERLHVQ